jgi:hypothetical protein
MVVGRQTLGTAERLLLDASCLMKGLEPCCAVVVAICAVLCGLRLDRRNLSLWMDDVLALPVQKFSRR